MSKSLYIAEKPSVAREFASSLNIGGRSMDGYIEGEAGIVTWCVGHLVTMSYPEAYDIRYRKWNLDDLPFIPRDYKYEIIGQVAKQYNIISGLMKRDDVDCIYVCTDSGREGEYIFRLVDMMVGVNNKRKLRVWIDSQTTDEIRRGVKEAKELSAYDYLGDAAFLRAKEDYLMGINFSRALTCRYGSRMNYLLGRSKGSIAVGRVMTCVLGMVVTREREIRDFVKTAFYRIEAIFDKNGSEYVGSWKADSGSHYYQNPNVYKDTGFIKDDEALEAMARMQAYVDNGGTVVVEEVSKKKEIKKPPLLYNLADLQNECSKIFKISPDETLKIAQELYEKKLITYPRTDARVLSKAVASQIENNIKGLTRHPILREVAVRILENKYYINIKNSQYVNDKLITDHYALIPTGILPQSSLTGVARGIYDLITKRFLAIFLEPAVFRKLKVITKIDFESFYTNNKIMLQEGYLELDRLYEDNSKVYAKETDNRNSNDSKVISSDTVDEIPEDKLCNEEEYKMLDSIRKGSKVSLGALEIKKGETTPPKRYNSGSMIIAMENAGNQIEDEELRKQIRSIGIGTSATRAGILTKLFNISYLSLNKKTQIIRPTSIGEVIYDIVYHSIRPLLNPALTASWEKGLEMVSEGKLTKEEYTDKLNDFVARRTAYAVGINDSGNLEGWINYAKKVYKI